jgi:hypothetical protein
VRIRLLWFHIWKGMLFSSYLDALPEHLLTSYNSVRLHLLRTSAVKAVDSAMLSQTTTLSTVRRKGMLLPLLLRPPPLHRPHQLLPQRLLEPSSLLDLAHQMPTAPRVVAVSILANALDRSLLRNVMVDADLEMLNLTTMLLKPSRGRGSEGEAPTLCKVTERSCNESVSIF